jgi:hypothetical protein
MAPKLDSTDATHPDSVVLASFANRHSAERMLASLGRDFRRATHKRNADAFIILGNADGSLKLTESRVVTVRGIEAALLHVGVSTMAGFIGIRSALRGARSEVHAVHVHQSHVGEGAERAHEILAQAGPHAAVALVRCKDPQLSKVVATKAADKCHFSWDGPREEFLAGLDSGTEYDWLRSALSDSKAHG